MSSGNEGKQVVIFSTDKNKFELKSDPSVQQLEAFRKHIKVNYDATGDAKTALLAIKGIQSALNGTPSQLLAYQYAKLSTLECDIRLSNAKTIGDLETVRRTAENSLDLLSIADSDRSVIVPALASASLYLSVAVKASGNKTDAMDVLARSKKELRTHFDTNYLEEVLLNRQMTLIEQEEQGFSNLFENVFSYIEHDEIEAYASIKRVFEYCLNHGKQFEAEKIFPLLRALYRNVSPRLGLVARISFEKNIGHYFMICNKVKVADRILSRALSHSMSANFHGQSMQIQSLLDEIRKGGKLILPTFEI